MQNQIRRLNEFIYHFQVNLPSSRRISSSNFKPVTLTRYFSAHFGNIGGTYLSAKHCFGKRERFNWIFRRIFGTSTIRRKENNIQACYFLQVTLRSGGRIGYLKWDAPSRWSFGPDSARGSMEATTIEKTYPTLPGTQTSNVNLFKARFKNKSKKPFGKTDENMKKNRYRNIVPYDTHRVPLGISSHYSYV